MPVQVGKRSRMNLPARTEASGTSTGEHVPHGTQIVSARALLVSCEQRTPDGGAYSSLLERLVSSGLVTAWEAATYAGPPSAEVVAELIAQARAVDAIANARARLGEES